MRAHRVSLYVVLAGVFVATATRAFGQQTGGTVSPTESIAAQRSVASPLGLPTLDSVAVVDVALATNRRGEAPHDVMIAGLGDAIEVRVRNFGAVWAVANCLSGVGQPVPTCQKRGIALYLAGREVRGLPAERFGRAGEEGMVFHLARTADSEQLWVDLLGSPSASDSRFFYRDSVSVSIGLDDASPIPTGKTMSLRRMSKGWFVGCALALVPLLLGFGLLAEKSALLRDGGPIIRLHGNGAPVPHTYSLARAQVAIWFVLVTVAFLYIWLTTGSTDTLTPSVLALMGIGAANALGGAAIDANKQAGGALPQPHTTFLEDTLTDSNGYVIHRFQMLTWTLVLAVVFIHSVWQRLSMPEFSPTLLSLMGISAGTYLGFKIPEK